MFKKVFRFIILAAGIVFLGMQVDRPAKNISNDQSKHLSTVFAIPESVDSILTVACYDCHSNNTRYPWYAEFQPVGQWLDGHIRLGKKELNFSEFASYRPRKQYHKLEEIEEMVKDNLMPLSDYTIMHHDARLSDNQKSLLIAWTKTIQDSLKLIHHPDSLKVQKR
ncbi:MAG: heme-binding domain-containing protein [Bacteroidota bacterium]|jgi:hypothetical protein